MVATVVNLTCASSTVHYFEKDGYYAKNDPEHKRASRWHGQGAKALKLGLRVDPKKFEKVLQGFVPRKDIRLGRMRDGVHEHRAGLDITLSAPKSVSLEALLYGEEKVLEAHEGAVRATLDFIEQQLLMTREYDRATKRSTRVPANGMVAATFRHVASRNCDPQLHTHAVLANMTRNKRGEWRSLELGSLPGAKHLIGAHYRNELARRLLDKGYKLVPSMIGKVNGFEISGYKHEMLEAFSSRRREILKYLKDHNLPYTAANAQRAALAVRKSKHELHLTELNKIWHKQADELGVARDRKATRVRRGEPRQQTTTLSALEIVTQMAAHLEERDAVFSANKLLALSLAHSPGAYGLDAIEESIAQLVNDGHLIETQRRNVGRSYVTKRTVRAEKEVISRMKAGMETSAAQPLVDAVDVAAALEDSGLFEGQQDAVRTILLSSARTVGVQGYAGTGKTTMLRQTVHLCGDRKVVGLAPSSSAADTLSREAGIPARTLQSFLARYRDVADNVVAPQALAELREEFAGALVVVDEMSLVSTRQARDLLRIADRLGIARLAMVGDKKQLRSVEAGQPFRQLQDAGMPTAYMDRIIRQRDDMLRGAVRDVIEGQPRAALDKLGDNLLEVPLSELGETAAQVWLRLSAEARVNTSIVAPTHELRRRIADTIRDGLRNEGVLSGRTLEIETLVDLRLTAAQKEDARNYRLGDVVLGHREMINYRIAADDACTITLVENDMVYVAHPDGKPRHIRPAGNARYSYNVYETANVSIQAGDRIRWTRNDNNRELRNGQEARIVQIGTRKLYIETEDGRQLTLAHDDPQLRHITHAYASTLHGAQGTTQDRVIAVLDSGHQGFTDQSMVYVGISRARDQALVLTDNREYLIETLETNSGESLTALEAIPEMAKWDLDDEQGQEPAVESPVAEELPQSTWDSYQAKQNAAAEAAFSDWCKARDRHVAAANTAGVYVAVHPGYDQLTAKLRQIGQREGLPKRVAERIHKELERHMAAAAMPKRIRQHSVRIEQGIARRGALGDPQQPDNPSKDVTMDPAYEQWRLTIETVTAAAEREQQRDNPYGMPSGSKRLNDALISARRILRRDNALISKRMTTAYATKWRHDWDAMVEAENAGRIDSDNRHDPQTLLERLDLILDHPALPLPLVDEMRARVDFRSWCQTRDSLEDEAKISGCHVYTLPKAQAAIVAADRHAQNSALPNKYATVAQAWASAQRMQPTHDAKAICDLIEQKLSAVCVSDINDLHSLYEGLEELNLTAIEMFANPELSDQLRTQLYDTVDKINRVLIARRAFEAWDRGVAEYEQECHRQQLDPFVDGGFDKNIARAKSLCNETDIAPAHIARLENWLSDIDRSLFYQEKSELLRQEMDRKIAELEQSGTENLSALRKNIAGLCSRGISLCARSYFPEFERNRLTETIRRAVSCESEALREEVFDTLEVIRDDDFEKLPAAYHHLDNLFKDVRKMRYLRGLSYEESEFLVPAENAALASLRANTEFQKWARGVVDYELDCQQQQSDPFADGGFEQHITVATDVCEITYLAPAQLARVQTWLADCTRMQNIHDRSEKLRQEIKTSMSTLVQSGTEKLAALCKMMAGLRNRAEKLRADDDLPQFERTRLAETLSEATKCESVALRRVVEDTMAEVRDSTLKNLPVLYSRLEKFHGALLTLRFFSQYLSEADAKLLAATDNTVDSSLCAMYELEEWNDGVDKYIQHCQWQQTDPFADGGYEPHITRATTLCENNHLAPAHRVRLENWIAMQASVNDSKAVRNAIGQAMSQLSEVIPLEDWKFPFDKFLILQEDANVLLAGTDLPESERQKLADAADVVRRCLNAIYEFKKWLLAWEELSTKGEGMVADPEYEALMATAKRLAKNTKLPVVVRNYIQTLVEQKQRVENVAMQYDDWVHRWNERVELFDQREEIAYAAKGHKDFFNLATKLDGDPYLDKDSQWTITKWRLSYLEPYHEAIRAVQRTYDNVYEQLDECYRGDGEQNIKVFDYVAPELLNEINDLLANSAVLTLEQRSVLQGVVNDATEYARRLASSPKTPSPGMDM